jgi:hypothetical protein
MVGRGCTVELGAMNISVSRDSLVPEFHPRVTIAPRPPEFLM